jgi:Protein of unknown function (DUF2490)
MNFCTKFLLAVVITFGLNTFAYAQTNLRDDEDVQSWNDVQFTIPLNKRVDLLLQTTFRFGRNITELTEARGGGGLSFKLTKALSVSPTYLYIESRNTASLFRTEHRYSIRGTYKFPTKKFGLSHRSIYEYRVRSSGNTWRYRPSLTFEKALPEKLIPKAKFFITEEPFYVSTTRKFSRNRFSLGVSKTINTHLTLDVYYLRQNDGFSHPGDLNVLGTSWKIHL